MILENNNNNNINNNNNNICEETANPVDKFFLCEATDLRSPNFAAASSEFFQLRPSSGEAHRYVQGAASYPSLFKRSGPGKPRESWTDTSKDQIAMLDLICFMFRRQPRTLDLNYCFIRCSSRPFITYIG